MDTADSKILLTLRGSEAQRGLPLSALESFLERFSRALVDFDRSRRGQATRKSGRRTAREEHVVGFRVVELRPGSAIMELEPLTDATADEESPTLEVEMLAVENLRSLMSALDDEQQALDPDVTQSIEAARRALGRDGTISLEMSRGQTSLSRVLIDELRVEQLAARKPRREEIVSHVAGLLTMVDIEPPFRVAIRASNNVKWNCRYNPELEKRVTALLKHHVSARGSGVRVNARRGYFEIENLEEVKEFEQTPLFSVERRPLDALLREQEITRPQGWRAFADPEWNEDDEGSAVYLRSLLQGD
jgi:hypothetical protein